MYSNGMGYVVCTCAVYVILGAAPVLSLFHRRSDKLSVPTAGCLSEETTSTHATELSDAKVNVSVAFFVAGYNDSGRPVWTRDTDDVFMFSAPQHCPPCNKTGQIEKDTVWTKKPEAWWCAQRHYLNGLAQLVAQFPQSDYYFLADTDTVVFRKRLRSMLLALSRNASKPRDDIFMGHAWTLPGEFGTGKDLKFVMTGGGVLLSGNALRRLNNTGKLDECSEQSLYGAHCWYHYDWALTTCLSSVGILPQGHEAFQQSPQAKWRKVCDETAVACHPVKHVEDQRQVIRAHNHFDQEFAYDSAQPCPDDKYEWRTWVKRTCRRGRGKR
eukprot:gnl/TRDRNA2_/TRDRNA2_176103_c0_seq27.p1 gnl/TRDRNA2_/TRDRNA2_176103_c0~~gnl/TRDRNA2_/TRDRNA2_176103_c0_seq27.p1  ORF type:complete len:335 (+),score=16.12 gnl/TRDRNA2_/TRDRNA2_176103_c0_seq27:27-1007(+)